MKYGKNLAKNEENVISFCLNFGILYNFFFKVEHTEGTAVKL